MLKSGIPYSRIILLRLYQIRNHFIYGVVYMSSISTEEFSVRLKYAREELRKISQGKLAELTGFKPAAISHFETGARKPSFDNLKRLADALEVTTDYLLGRVDNPEEIKEADQLYRDIKNLSSTDKEFAEKMIAEMVKRGKK